MTLMEKKTKKPMTTRTAPSKESVSAKIKAYLIRDMKTFFNERNMFDEYFDNNGALGYANLSDKEVIAANLSKTDMEDVIIAAASDFASSMPRPKVPNRKNIAYISREFFEDYTYRHNDLLQRRELSREDLRARFLKSMTGKQAEDYRILYGDK